MSDKNMQNNEYQYPGDEYVVAPKEAEQTAAEPDVAAPVASRTSGWQRFAANNKRNIVVFGVVIVGVIVFQTMRHKAPTDGMPAVKPVASSMIAAPTDDQLLLQKSMAELQQNNDANNQEIANLKSQLASVNGQLQTANQANDQLKQAMVLLMQELRNLNDKMAKRPTTVVVAQKAEQPGVVYAVRAMVDGRAWIQGSNGLSMSVTLGDPIPDYGNVTGIQAAQGLIQTSSGKVIRLGSNDY